MGHNCKTRWKLNTSVFSAMVANFGKSYINLHDTIRNEARISTNLTSRSITEPRKLHYIIFSYLVLYFNRVL